MKFIDQIKAGLISLGVLVAASAEDAVKFNVPGVSTGTAQPAAAAPAKPKFTETQMAEAYGWFTGMRMGLSQLGFTKTEVESMGRGMLAASTGAEPTFDPKEMGPELEAYLGKRSDVYTTKLRSESLAQGVAFFTKLKENKNVVELPSGLRYEILKATTGATPKLGQIVTAHYTGTLASGKVFDSSVERGEPAQMALEQGEIIPGMIEGLQKTGVGGKIKLYIPPSLAYSGRGNQVIPPGATLIFELEVISVADAKAAPKASVTPAPAPVDK